MANAALWIYCFLLLLMSDLLHGQTTPERTVFTSTSETTTAGDISPTSTNGSATSTTVVNSTTRQTVTRTVHEINADTKMSTTPIFTTTSATTSTVTPPATNVSTQPLTGESTTPTTMTANFTALEFGEYWTML